MTPITTIAELEDSLSQPTPGAIETLQRIAGDVMVLGAGGKMGPTLSRMLRRSLDLMGDTSRRVIAVSRFSSTSAMASLQHAGVETIACDLTNQQQIHNLPVVPNVFYLVGQKFGTHEAPEATWFTNTVVPSLIAERFAGSRIVALSTGCVYPLVSLTDSGSSENDPPGPPGEYANSCVGRERVFEYHARRDQTPMIFVRLCYAIDLRYGVLLDLAQRIVSGQPIDLGMAATHVIWQGDANARIIQCLQHTQIPPIAVNLTGRDRLSIQSLALRLGELLNREVQFRGEPGPSAWLWNSQRSYDWFGPPAVTIDEMLQATADWVRHGGPTLNRPTHFEVSDGKF